MNKLIDHVLYTSEWRLKEELFHNNKLQLR